jgi:GGDEF domain-containing protein
MQPFVNVYPLVVLGVGTVLGWYFNRCRVVFALLILAVVDITLRRFGAEYVVQEDVARFVFNALAVLVPLNLAAYALLKERGLFTPQGLTRLASIAAQVLMVDMIVRLDWRGPRDWLPYSFLDGRLTAWTAVPQTALAAFVLAVFVLGVRSVYRRDPIEVGFLATLMMVFMALHGMRWEWVPTTSLATVGLTLIWGVLKTAYRMAYHDDLTGLPGRRALNEDLLRVGSRYAVAMVDVDHFKRFNDLFGHEVGDQALRMVAAKLSRIGGGGKAFRYGGEEFVVLFARTPAAEAVSHLEAVRRDMSASRFILRGPGRPRKKPPALKPPTGPRVDATVTISIGLAEPDDRKRDPQQVLRAADKALYRAKRAGRNRLMV